MDELKKTMFLLCETGNFVAIQDILKQGVSVNCQDDIGSTPLHVAAAYGRVELVDALVREGAEIDRPNNFGWTPIMQAARNGQSNVAIKLLNNGVNVNLKNKLGANLLTLAVASNDEKTITAVINDMSHKIVDLSLDPLPLVIASLQGFTDVVSTLLKKGFNPNTATLCTGLTALMMASYNGHYSVAEQLLKNNCDPEITNCINQNALDIALEMGHEKIQSLLTKNTKVRSNSFANQQHKKSPQGWAATDDQQYIQTCDSFSLIQDQFSMNCHILNPSVDSSLFSHNCTTPIHSPESVAENYHFFTPQEMNIYPFSNIPTSPFPGSSLYQHLGNPFIHIQVPCSPNPCFQQAYFNSVQRHSYSPPLDNSQRQPLTPLTRLYPSTCHCNYYYHSSLIHFVTPPRQHVHSRYECTQEWLTKQEGMRFSQSSPSGLKNYKKNKGFKHWWKQVTSRFVGKKLKSSSPHYLGKANGHLNVSSKCTINTKNHPTTSRRFLNFLDARCNNSCSVSNEIGTISRSNKCEIDHLQDDTTVLSTSKPVLSLDSFLLKLGLQEYIPIFTKQEIDWNTIFLLTTTDLEEMGVHSPEARIQIINALNAF